jgi:hypothetical protein
MHIGLQVKMGVMSSLLNYCQECYFNVIGGGRNVANMKY